MKPATESLRRLPWTLPALGLLGALVTLSGGCGGSPAPASGPPPATGLVGTWTLSDSPSLHQISFAADGTVTIDDTTSSGVRHRSGTYSVSGEDLTLEQQPGGTAPHTRVTSSFYQYMDRLAISAYYPQGSHQGLVGTWLNHTVTEVVGATVPTIGDLRTTYLFTADGRFTSTQVLSNQGMQQSPGTWTSVSNEVYSISYGDPATPDQTPIYLLDQAVVSTQIFNRTAAPSTSP